MGRRDPDAPDLAGPEELTTTDKKLKRSPTTTDKDQDTALADRTDDLHVPDALSETEARFARSLLEDLEPKLAQMVVDELAGAMADGVIPESPMAYLRGLVRNAKDGDVQPRRGRTQDPDSVGHANQEDEIDQFEF